jgi:hypothetical protein
MDEIRRLQTELREFPQEIYRAELDTEEKRDTWNRVRLEREYKFSKAFLTAKAGGSTDNLAKHQASVEVAGIDGEVLAAESRYRKSEATRMFLENRYAGIRKEANLIEAQVMKLGS